MEAILYYILYSRELQPSATFKYILYPLSRMLRILTMCLQFALCVLCSSKGFLLGP